MVTNKIFWNELSSDQQDLIQQAMQEATEFNRKKAAELNQQNLDAIKASGKTEIHTLSDAQRQTWKDQLKTIYPKFYDVIGKDLIQRTLDTSF